MDQFNNKIYKMYIALKKQKELDDELAKKREADIVKFRGAAMDVVKDLEGKNEELRRKMSDMLDEHKKEQETFLREIREKDKENLRLNLLLAGKTAVNSSTPAESRKRTPEILQENPTPVSPAKKTPQSNSKAKRARLSQEAIPLENPTPVSLAKKTPRSNNNAKRARLSQEAVVPNSSSPGMEARELERSGSHMRATGNEANESSSALMFHMLESLVCMKISLNKEQKGFSFAACHEDTGYSFTLTWLEQSNEWSYMVSSLGTLDSVAFDWMNQDIRFSMGMCRRFFQRISDAIKKSCPMYTLM